jgi:hypothetical protein
MPSPENAQALVALCNQVLPVWVRQLASSRSQSEAAVAEMLSAFAEIGPHLERASRQSLQITAALDQGTDGGITQLARACDKELQPLLTSLDEPVAQAVQRVMTMVHASVDALEQIPRPFAHETRMVSAQIERMYKGFQYQDRISQMMTLLLDDMSRLQSAMCSGGADLEASAWLARLESQYVMSEQRHHHNDAAGEAAADDDETTFF